jgi:hypothetical protein
MPPALAEAFRLLDTISQVAFSLAGLLAFVLMGQIAWCVWRRPWGMVLAACLIGLIGLSLLFLFIPPASWLALASHSLYLVVIILLVVRAAPGPGDASHLRLAGWIALFVPALALVCGRLHQALPALYAALHWPGPVPFTALLFNWGELFVAVGAFALWWAYGREARWWAWLVAAVPALAYTALYLANTYMTGILTIWSTGLTLYLPWPLYAAAIWLAATTLLAPRAWTQGAGWAILLLAAGGYAPQLSAQAFFSLLALCLLAGLPRQQTTKNRVEPHTSYPFVTTAHHQLSHHQLSHHQLSRGMNIFSMD